MQSDVYRKPSRLSYLKYIPVRKKCLRHSDGRLLSGDHSTEGFLRNVKVKCDNLKADESRSQAECVYYVCVRDSIYSIYRWSSSSTNQLLVRIWHPDEKQHDLASINEPTPSHVNANCASDARSRAGTWEKGGVISPSRWRGCFSTVAAQSTAGTVYRLPNWLILYGSLFLCHCQCETLRNRADATSLAWKKGVALKPANNSHAGCDCSKPKEPHLTKRANGGNEFCSAFFFLPCDHLVAVLAFEWICVLSGRHWPWRLMMKWTRILSEVSAKFTHSLIAFVR